MTPGFFQTMKIPIVRGRGFTPEDRAGAPRVVVISQSLAARLWPGGDAIGHRFYWGGVGGRTRTVVGVVGDIRDVQLDAQPHADGLPVVRPAAARRHDAASCGRARARLEWPTACAA